MSSVRTNVLQWWNAVPGFVQLVSIGVLLGSSFLHPYLAPLLLIGLPLFWQQILSAPSRKAAIWRGWLPWYIKSVFVMSWMWSTYPLVWVTLGDSAWLQLSVITFYIATVALWISSAGVLIGIGVWYLSRLMSMVWLRLVVAALVVVGAELLGATLFAIANSGPNIPVSGGFSYGAIGMPVVVLPGAVGWSVGYGLYGLSFLIAVYTLGIVWVQNTRQVYWVVAGLCVICVGGGVVLQSTQYAKGHIAPQSPTAVAVIETDFTAQLHQTESGLEIKRNMLKDAFTAAMDTAPGYVLFPEDARFVRYAYPDLSAREAYNYLRLEYDDFDTIVIDSARVESAAGAILRATLYDGVTKSVSQVDKQYLVPQGEYVPYFYKYIFQTLGYSDVVADLEQQAYFPGPYIQPTTNDAAHLPAILFCFASSNAWGVADVLNTNATSIPFVAHVISHSWFHSPTLLWYQTDQFLRVQAIWNQVPIVSAGNLAPSKVYWPDGRVTEGEVVAEGELWRVRMVTLP